MFKKLLLAAVLVIGVAGAGVAHDTTAADIVNVSASAYKGAVSIYEKTYSKPWGQIKLAKSTNDKLIRAINAVKKKESFYSTLKYKIIGITMVNDELVRFVAISNHNNVVAVDFSDDMFCSIAVDCQNSLHVCSTCEHMMY